MTVNGSPARTPSLQRLPRLRYRPMRAADLAECLALMPESAGLTPAQQARMPDLWARLVGEPSILAGVIEDTALPEGERLQGWGVTMVLPTPTVKALSLETHPSAYVTRRVYAALLAGELQPPSDREIGVLNASGELVLLILHYSMRHNDYFDPYVSKVIATANDAFRAFHDGYNLRALPVLLLLLLLGLASPAAATTLTVLYFDNDSGDPAFQHLGKGLADMMITDLSAAPGVQVVEREKLEALLKELKLQRTRYFDPKTAQRIGKGLGAAYAVTGSFVAASPQLRLDVRVVRIDSGAVVKAHQVTGQREQFFELYQRLVAALVDGLGDALRGGGGSVKAAVGKNRVDDVGAALDYGDALDKRDSGDLKGASQQMQKAMQRAPGFGLAKSRYMQIMKELYAAKDVRSEQLSGAEGALLASMDRHIAKKDDGGRFAYRILRGYLMLRRLASASAKPGKAQLPLLAAYRENQERLIEELIELEGRTEIEYNPEISVKSIEAEDMRLARELGLPFPSSTTANNALEELAATLVFAYVPVKGIEMAKHPCYYKADASLITVARKLLGRVQPRIDRRAAQYKKKLQQNRQPTSWAEDEQAAQTIDLVQTQAQVDLAAGAREEAIAKLQGLLTRYPKSRKFQETEQMIRGILDGSDKLADGTPLLGCEDPR